MRHVRFLTTAALLLAPVLAFAQASEAALERARAAYRKADMREAMARLDDAESAPGVTDAQLAEISWFRAACHHARAESAKRDAALDRLLGVMPLYLPSKADGPPDLRAGFTARAEAWQGAHGARFGEVTVDGARLRVPVAGTVDRVETLELFLRAAGEPTFTPYTCTFTGSATACELADKALWERAARAGGLEAILEARWARGVPQSRRGSHKEPVRIAVTPDDARRAADALAPPPPVAPAPPPAAVPAPTPPPADVIQQAPAATPAPAPAAPEPAAPSRLPLLARAAGGAVAASGGAVLLVAGAAGLVAAGSLLGMYLQPHDVGTQAAPAYRALLYAWAGGLLVAPALLLGSLVLVALGGGGLAASFLL